MMKTYVLKGGICISHSNTQNMKRKIGKSQFACESFVPQYSMENAVDFVVLKHRWRWKPVNENEDEEVLHSSFLTENALRICRLIVSEKMKPRYQTLLTWLRTSETIS